VVPGHTTEHKGHARRKEAKQQLPNRLSGLTVISEYATNWKLKWFQSII